MKRLIKLLSIFGVLIILGSCGTSSKSVNVSSVNGSTQYAIFKDYDNNTYPIALIEITGGAYSKKSLYTGDQFEIDPNTSYDITWYWIKGTSQESKTKYSYQFNSDYGTQTIHIGTDTYSSIFY